jgi:hypothetical protein
MNDAQDAFVKKATAEIRDIARREEALIKQEDDIKRRRSELRLRLAELTKTLAVYKSLMGIGTETAVATQSDAVPIKRESAAGETIADVAFSVMSRQGEPMKIGDLVTELQKLGKLKGGGASGRGDYGTLYRTLNRDRRFVRSDKGEFSLSVVSPSAPEQPSEQSPVALPE